MKKSILFVYFFICIIGGCTDNEKLDRDSVIEYCGKNLRGKELVEKLGKQGETLIEYLGNSKKALFDYTRLGWIGQYGLHFSVPVLDTRSGVVTEYLIYPLSSFYCLENYVVVDEKYLDSIAQKEKFLYSKQFLRWKQEGLEVNRELYFYAEQLDGEIVLSDKLEVGLSRSALDLGQYEGRIQYYIDCSDVGPGVWGVTWNTRYDAFTWAEEQLYMAFPLEATWLDVAMDYVTLKITARSIQSYGEARLVFEGLVREAEWFLSQDLYGVRIDYSIDMVSGTVGGNSSTGGSSTGGASTGGSTTGGNTNDPSNPTSTEWWAEGHRKIVRAVLEKLNLSSDVIDAINEGSKAADKSLYQKTEYAHMHAMRSPGDSVEETISKMRGFFREQIDKFYTTGDLESIGMALHPIMDAYSPAHELRVWNGKVWNYVPHCFEASFFYYKKIQKAQDALQLVCDDLFVKGFFDRPDLVFNNWLYGPYGPKNPQNMKK